MITAKCEELRGVYPNLPRISPALPLSLSPFSSPSLSSPAAGQNVPAASPTKDRPAKREVKTTPQKGGYEERINRLIDASPMAMLDEEGIHELCLLVIATDEQGVTSVLKALKPRIKDLKHPKHCLAGLTIMDELVKRCPAVHVQIATEDWTKRFLKLYNESNVDNVIKQKILQLLVNWRDMFKLKPELSAISRACAQLFSSGVSLPPVTDTSLVEGAMNSGSQVVDGKVVTIAEKQKGSSGSSKSAPRDAKSAAMYSCHDGEDFGQVHWTKDLLLQSSSAADTVWNPVETVRGIDSTTFAKKLADVGIGGPPSIAASGGSASEMKARLAELEGIVAALETDREALRSEVKDLRESGGASAGALADAASVDEMRDTLQKTKSELEKQSVLLTERQADWTLEKEGYLKLHRSLEGQLSDLKEQLAKQGHEYEELKVSLMKDLQNRCEKVVELQINLDEARENYHRLLQNSNHRVLSRKVLYLERSLETLKAAYQESVSQKSTLRIDKQVAEKKCEQKEREIKSLEATIKELKEDNRNLKMQLGSGSAYESYMSSVGMAGEAGPRVGLRGGGGVHKSLRGGGLRGGGAGGGSVPPAGSPAVEAAEASPPPAKE
jgi:hypothetical protein